MDWKDLAKYVKQHAPTIGAYLGGPAGAAVGGGVSLLASAFGIESNEPDQVLKAIQADPEAAVKLRKLELEHKIEWEKLILKQEEIRLADVSSARNREIEIAKVTGSRDINLYILAWIVVGCFFLLVGILMKVTLPTANIGPINQLFGAMATGFGMVLQYFFGSSKSSSDKSKLLAGTGK